MKQSLGLVVCKKIYPKAYIARVRAPCFFVVSEEIRACGCQEIFLGGCAISVDFGFGYLHVQTPSPRRSIEVVETVLDVDVSLTCDEDVVNVRVVACASVCARGGHCGRKMVEEGVKVEDEK